MTVGAVADDLEAAAEEDDDEEEEGLLRSSSLRLAVSKELVPVLENKRKKHASRWKE